MDETTEWRSEAERLQATVDELTARMKKADGLFYLLGRLIHETQGHEGPLRECTQSPCDDLTTGTG